MGGVLKGRRLVHALLQELIQRSLHGLGPVDLRTGSVAVCADRDQVRGIRIRGQPAGRLHGRTAVILADDVRCGHACLLASVVDGPDDVAGVLLFGVVHRRGKVRAAAVVVDGQAATDVEQVERTTQAVQLDKQARRFAQGRLPRADRRDLFNPASPFR